jgi:hypothetical protein
VCTFDHPTILAELAAVFGATLRDYGPDAALAQRTAVSRRIVAAIGIDGARLLKGAATNTTNRWNRINEPKQLRDVVGVRAGQDRDYGNAVGGYKDTYPVWPFNIAIASSSN